MNQKLLDALACQNQGRAPVWLMRQAGRYLPEYRALKEKYSFTTMCRTPEIAAEVTMQPIRRFGMDAAILFSDILVIADVFGRSLEFKEGVGPLIDPPIRTNSDVEALSKERVKETLHYVPEAIKLLKKELDVPLIGFCGAPFTVASYFVEGGSSQRMKRTKMWMLNDPEGFSKLLDAITDVTITYLNMQIEAGVDAIQIFDSWASFLPSTHLHSFSVRYAERMIQGLSDPTIPVILFSRGAAASLPVLKRANPSCLALDWTIDLSHARKVLGPDMAIQGNLDPDFLYSSSSVIEKEVHNLLSSMRNDPGYIMNLGHGIRPDVPIESVSAFVNTVKAYA